MLTSSTWKGKASTRLEIEDRWKATTMGDPIRELIHFETADAINPQLPSKSCHLAYSPHWANKVKASELTCQQPRFSTDPDWAVFLNIIRQRPPTTQDDGAQPIPFQRQRGWSPVPVCPAARTWPRCGVRYLSRSQVMAKVSGEIRALCSHGEDVCTDQCRQEYRAGQVGG